MPKRRSEDEDCAYLERKIKKLERKLERKKSKRRSHRSRSTRSRSHSICSLRRSPSPVKTPKEHGSEEQMEPIASTSAQAAAHPAVLDFAADTLLGSAQPQIAPSSLESTNEAVLEQEGLVPELDDAILEILGIDPNQVNVFGAEIQKEFATRLEYYACNGLSKENRKELKEKYLVPSNCKLINAPNLNAELKAALSQPLANRDKAIEVEQARLASAISALGQALTILFSCNEKHPELIKILMDTSRILCDSQHSHSMRRRGLVISSLRKDMKDSLQSMTKIDNYLFGQGLAEALKTAKAVSKSGTELKATPIAKPPISKKQLASTTRPLNWKGPIQPRRQQEPSRTQEPVMTRFRQSNSSIPSQHRPQRNIRRR